MKVKLLVGVVLGLSVLITVASPAQAQQSMLKANARQKSEFYNAPRRIHIVDERPIISDFREAPQAPSMVQLPPPPQGFAGMGGGQGGGFIPGQGGDTTPAMQLAAGPGIAPYRTPSSNGMIPLDRVGFGRYSNIPARGMGPRVALQNGSTTGVHAQMMPIAKSAPNPLSNGNRAIAANPANFARPQQLASYNGNYTQAQGATNTAVSGTLVNTAVRGHMISKLK